MIAGPGLYLCESCLTLLATRERDAGVAKRCSFCGRRNVPVAGAWSSVAICVGCVELARGILAEDDRPSRPAT
jgi:hypothetical protein